MLQQKAGDYLLSRKQKNRMLNSIHLDMCLEHCCYTASQLTAVVFSPVSQNVGQMDSQSWVLLNNLSLETACVEARSTGI